MMGIIFQKPLIYLKTQQISLKVYTDFQKKLVSAIKEYGGLPIYASGDDGFFFAPW